MPAATAFRPSAIMDCANTVAVVVPSPAAVEELKKLSVPCSDTKAIAQVGTISANSDETVGTLIAQAM
ncbi:hypothetical protein, partial [Pseudomonas aeruginosa]|uniref:hypothetical protein n=1 Tax=Pseudomonas aeruginosa TaxID=287 RepID=UPI0011C49C09